MSRFPLLLLHHAGGSARVFDALVAALPPHIEPITLDLPGRGLSWREEPAACAEEAIDWLVARTAGIDGEFAVFGHSLGAYLGLGLIARLEEQEGGVRCSTLFASANSGPVGAVLPFEGSALATDDEEIFRIAEASGGVIDEQVRAHAQLRERTARLLRADFALSQSFLNKQRRTVTEAEIIVCCGSDDIFSAQQLEQWRLNSTSGTEIHRFSGGHFYLAENAEGVADVVAAKLALALA
ncbi:thioesterase [Streptomyces sp. 130]|uniref:thioesterase II family protein n=1 Tax=Streptomyces sp. 130 TaxID=2591006 RepID=UPI00117C5016|nr:alpha/beta fold hydrolase [Streptomyces sp. 130]TRV71534.1 thioesterase [Streptomyces sp. 130]